MKAIILTAILIYATASSFAQDQTAAKALDKKQDYVLMHEKMSMAHQQAADCLKSGKSEDECRMSFHEMCKESGGPDKCGPWMMHRKTGKKLK